MESRTDGGWILALSLAAKCGDATEAHRMFALVLIIFLFLFFCTALLHWASPGGPAWGKYLWSKNKSSSIPGPRGVPVIGNMGLMLGLAHRNLATVATSLAATRLMALSLGGTRVVITSDAEVAKEILNSSAFADRPMKESAYGLMFHRAIGFAPYGAYWSALRRIAATHLFCPRQVAASESHRSQIAAQIVRALGTGSEVRTRDVLKRASLHNVMWSVFGRKYELSSDDDSSDKEMKELKGLVEEGYDLLGKLNWSDHLPFLAGWDPQGIRFGCSRLVPKVNRFVTNIIEEHRSSEPVIKSAADFVDVLLSLRGSERLSDPDMVAVLWVRFFLFSHYFSEFEFNESNL